MDIANIGTRRRKFIRFLPLETEQRIQWLSHPDWDQISFSIALRRSEAVSRALPGIPAEGTSRKAVPDSVFGGATLAEDAETSCLGRALLKGQSGPLGEPWR